MTSIDFTDQRPIKWLSIGLMMLALGLEVSRLMNWDISVIPNVLLGIARIALVIHLIEGAIAFGAAALSQRFSRESAWRYGLYTFWVGTVGLTELLDASKSSGRSSDR